MSVARQSPKRYWRSSNNAPVLRLRNRTHIISHPFLIGKFSFEVALTAIAAFCTWDGFNKSRARWNKSIVLPADASSVWQWMVLAKSCHGTAGGGELMTGPLKTGRLPARTCPECKQSFLPKRIDTVLCSRECRNAEQKQSVAKQMLQSSRQLNA